MTIASFKPIHFFKRTAKFNKYAFANRPRTGPDFFVNANLYLKNVLGFVGKHPILQITPGEESWGLKSGILGARSNFWLFSAISFLSATVSFCFACIRYGHLFKSVIITFLSVDMLKFKDWLRRRSDRFGLRSTDSCTISTICCVLVLSRPEWLKRSEDFLIRLIAVLYVSNLLTQSWMTDLWSYLSTSKKVWNCSEIFLTEPHS